MGRINSRSKGRRGEKAACEALEEWTGYPFVRVPASGGLRWKNTTNSTGDFICDDPLHRFDFSGEAKNYDEINFEHLLRPDVNSKIRDEFWPQCKADAERGKKLPLLMMRYNGLPKGFFFVGMGSNDFIYLKSHHIFDGLIPKYPYMKVGGLVIMNSDLLFKSDYKAVKKLTHKIIHKLYGK